MFNFDFSDGYVILRIICGLFFIPHIVAKLTQRAGIFGFYSAAGFKPEGLWINAAIAAELIMTPCLVLGIFTQYAAAAAAFFLVVACLATYRASKGRWMWNFGGIEYPLFWAICCVIVAMHPT